MKYQVTTPYAGDWDEDFAIASKLSRSDSFDPLGVKVATRFHSYNDYTQSSLPWVAGLIAVAGLIFFFRK
jgi:hypothetical protein